jgi:hypothetical protein
MLRPLRTLAPVLALAAAVALPIAGCGSDTVDGLDPTAAVAQAADRTAAVEGMHVKMDAQLRQLKALGDIEEDGTEDVDGVPTTHYSGTLDLRKAADVVPADQREAARTSAEKLIELNGGKSEIPAELWVDDEGHIRRLVQTTPTQAGDVKVTVEYTDFGGTEAIEIPSQDDTYDISDALGS